MKNIKNVYSLATAAGILFGCWPLLMNRSGLSGFMSAAAFSGLCFATVLPFALYDGVQSAYNAKWYFVVPAGMIAGIGLLAFNTMLSKSSAEEVGPLFIIMMLVQIAVPAVYTGAMSGEISGKRLMGFGVAGVAVYLLR